MDKYTEFRDRLKQFDNHNLVDYLEIDRELLSEMDENDPLKFHFEWRIKLYQAELQIRKYFNDYTFKYSTELCVIEITVENYIYLLQLKSEFDCKSLNEKIIDSLSTVDRDEVILCAVKGTEIIIDIKTLMSKEEKFSYKNLSYWLNSYIKPDYQEISELPHLFWNYILEESNIFMLFREVGAAFLTFFDSKKIEKSQYAGSIYNTWGEEFSMQQYMSGSIAEKKFIDLYLEIITYNSDTEESKWYIFELNSRKIMIRIGDVGVSYELGDPYLNFDIINDYKLLLNSEKLNPDNIKSAVAQFIYSFSLLLPSTSYKSTIEKEIIHVLKYKFLLIEPKPKYESPK